MVYVANTGAVFGPLSEAKGIGTPTESLYASGEAAMADASGRSQSTKFNEAARELGCNEDEAHWDDGLRKVAKQKAEPENSNGA